MSSPPLLLSSISKLFTRKDFSVPPATPTLLLLRTIFLAPAGLRPPPVASAVVYGVPPKKRLWPPRKKVL